MRRKEPLGVRIWKDERLNIRNTYSEDITLLTRSWDLESHHRCVRSNRRALTSQETRVSETLDAQRNHGGHCTIEIY